MLFIFVSNGSFSPHLHSDRRVGNFAYLVTTDSLATLWFGPVPVLPLPTHDLYHNPTPQELVRLSAVDRPDFHGSFGAEAFALGCLLDFTSRHPHQGSDIVVSNCSSVLAIALGRARSRAGGLSALLRLLRWSAAATLMYCPSHLDYPLNQFTVPFSWGNSIADSGASIQGSCALHPMTVTMQSAQWTQLEYDPSCFIRPVAVAGPWGLIINDQMEDDEEDLINSAMA